MPVAPIIPTDDDQQSFSTGSVQVGDMNQLLTDLLKSGEVEETASETSAAKYKSDIYARMLSPLSEFRQSFNNIVGNVSIVVNSGEISMQELIMVQYQMTQLSYMNDLSAKTADKISQGLQTLFRNQG